MTLPITSLPTAPTALPFEQQPKESAKAYAAFRHYLELGPERSMAAVAKKLAKSEQLIRRWGFKYDWTARVKAHAAHVSEVERLAIEGLATEKAVEWVKTHDALKREAWRKGEELMKQCDDLLDLWRNASRPPGFESLVRGIELAFKLKQFAAGLPSEVKEVHNTIEGTLEVDWEIALRKAYGKVEVVDVEAKPIAAPKEGQ